MVGPVQGTQAVPLEPVMGAYAHLVAIDEARSGFAHLHPAAAEPVRDGPLTRLNFRAQFPRAGRYVIWAEVKVGGHERFIPFWCEVTG
jgi:hypothetical protein